MKTSLAWLTGMTVFSMASRLRGADVAEITEKAQRAAVETARQIEVGDVLVWVTTGVLAASVMGIFSSGSRAGFGMLKNLIVGLLGAVVGGFVFGKLGVNLGLGSFTMSYDDLVTAFVGACLLLLGVRLLQAKSSGAGGKR